MTKLTLEEIDAIVKITSPMADRNVMQEVWSQDKVDALKAAARAGIEAGERAGWVLVPREPTEKLTPKPEPSPELTERDAFAVRVFSKPPTSPDRVQEQPKRFMGETLSAFAVARDHFFPASTPSDAVGEEELVAEWHSVRALLCPDVRREAPMIATGDKLAARIEADKARIAGLIAENFQQREDAAACQRREYNDAQAYIAEIADLQSKLTAAEAENERLREALLAFQMATDRTTYSKEHPIWRAAKLARAALTSTNPGGEK